LPLLLLPGPKFELEAQSRPGSRQWLLLLRVAAAGASVTRADCPKQDLAQLPHSSSRCSRSSPVLQVATAKSESAKSPGLSLTPQAPPSQ